MNSENFISLFEKNDKAETLCIYTIFTANHIKSSQIIAFYELYIQAKNIGYKYNAHVFYEPFEIENSVNWDFFIIKNKKEILLKVYYSSNYTIDRIEDNLTALYY